MIIAGPNGAGKTTAAAFLLRDVLAVREYVNADPIAQGLSAFNPDTVALAAGRLMLARLDELARERVRFAFETMARVARRVALGGHGVPDEVVRRRYATGLRNFFHLYAPLVTSWRMYDTSDLPQPELIAYGSQGGQHEVAQPELWSEIVRQ
ncbi:MAG: hypothetical protein JOZ81_18115 [Chloroflexi bacterium]|nr:hypothetical protein [Chloroflexota bacterium]